MNAVNADNLTYGYEYESNKIHSIDGISRSLHKGEWIALFGQKKCGITLFVKHIESLLHTPAVNDWLYPWGHPFVIHQNKIDSIFT